MQFFTFPEQRTLHKKVKMSRPDDKASKLLESIPGFPPPIPEIQEVKVVMRLRASPPGRSGQQVCSPPQSDRPKLEAKKSMDYPMGFKTKESVFGPSNPETDSFVASPATSRKEDPVVDAPAQSCVLH
uniref:Uncharacterized protein n=1 Tax=Knipowitschia caucasica TaxID=637954 RepID=A0AAV2MF97_KNICA